MTFLSIILFSNNWSKVIFSLSLLLNNTIVHHATHSPLSHSWASYSVFRAQIVDSYKCLYKEFFSKYFGIYYKTGISFDWWAFGRLNIWRRERSEHWCILCLVKPVGGKIRFTLLRILLLISHAEQRESESTKPVIN